MSNMEVQLDIPTNIHNESIGISSKIKFGIWSFTNIFAWIVIPMINSQYTSFDSSSILPHLNNIQFMVFCIITSIMFRYSHLYQSIYTKKRIVLFYLLPLVFALHFSVLQHIPFIRPIILKDSQFDPHDTTYLIEIVGIVLFIITILSFQLYYISDRFKFMALSLLPVIIVHFIMFYRGTDNIHIHHYMVGLYIFMISYVNKKFSWITQMLGMGVFIDGVANNAFDPLYDTPS